MENCSFIAPFYHGEVLILFFKWEAYTHKITFLTKNVEHFPGIYYGWYTLRRILVKFDKIYICWLPDNWQPEYSILFHSILFFSILLYSLPFDSIPFCSNLFHSNLFYILFSIPFYFLLSVSFVWRFYSFLFHSFLLFSILFHSIPLHSVFYIFYLQLSPAISVQSVWRFKSALFCVFYSISILFAAKSSFKCAVCLKVFAEKRTLCMHLANHHGDVKQEPAGQGEWMNPLCSTVAPLNLT